MKILYITTKSNWGGAQRHVFDLAVAMKAQGHEVAVAVGGEGLLRKKLEEAGIYTHSIASLKRNINAIGDAISLKEIFSVIRHRRPDILHLHSPKAAGLGAFAGRILRIKSIVYTVHGWTFNEERPFFQKLLVILFSWLTMLLSHRTILLSTREYNQALNFPGVKNKLSLIPLGIKSPTFISVDGAKLALAQMISMGIPEFNKKTILGTIAELHRNKGLTYLIRAFAEIKDAHPETLCVIVGEGEEKTSLHMLIKELRLEGRVFLLGYVENASEYLKSFSVFVLPSVKEGLPYVILEAGSASLPVVSTTIGGIPEMIEDMKSGILIQPKNIRELSHALMFMVEHPVERRHYGAALKERVTTKFSLEKMTSSVRDLYEKMNRQETPSPSPTLVQ